MIVSKGKYFNKEYNMTEDVTITGGNFVLCRVITNGFNLDIQGGNVRGLYIDGVKQDTFTFTEYTRLGKAKEILDRVGDVGGQDAIDAWLWTVDYIFDNPTTTQAAWSTEFMTWATATGNMLDDLRAFVKIRNVWFPGFNFVQVRDELLGYSKETWHGEPTVPGTVYS